MAVIAAEPKSWSLDAAPGAEAVTNELVMSTLVSSGTSLGTNETLAGGEDTATWLEPGPGVQPAARTQIRATIAGRWGSVVLDSAAELFKLPEGQVFRFVFYTLTIAVARNSQAEILRWWLEPGGDDATRRADSLDFLRGLHAGGVLTLTNALDNREIAALRIDPKPFDPELESSRTLLGHIAMLEEWSGSRIKVPDTITAEQATKIVRAAAIVTSRQVPLSLGEQLEIVVSAAANLSTVDELRLPRELEETILDQSVAFGTTVLAVRVRALSAESLDGGLQRVQCALADDQPRNVVTHLHPPVGRSRIVRRTTTGGLGIPPRASELVAQIQAVHSSALGEFLEEWEAEVGPPSDALLEQIREQWPI